ncbi:MAG: 4-hydroxy-tetrahydrodipicolinate synthase [Bacteroidetes bacterium]|nr:4-hydroxy-tetrahydrodipicolinate synthase [Bacteroidota bacterium]
MIDKPLHLRLKGTGVAIVTPFQEDSSIDYPSLGNLIEYLIQSRVEYIVFLGTTGESVTLSKLEKAQVIEFAVKTVKGRIPVVAGVGGNQTGEVVHQLRSLPLSGVDAVLSVSPYYNKPQQEGLFQHFKAVAEASPVPVILYNVPGRTGSNMTAETTLRIAHQVNNIIGIKEASGNFDQIYRIIRGKPDGFLVISGDDGITLPLLAAGADGVISVVANAFPALFSDMVRLGLQGSFDQARIIHYRLIEFTNALFADGSPAGIKAALSVMNKCKNVLRLPLVPVNPHVLQHIELLAGNIAQEK